MVHIKIFSIIIKPWHSICMCHVTMDYHSDFALSIIIIYFENVHFFHSQLWLDICLNMKSLLISLNTAHSGCKPSIFMTSFTHTQKTYKTLLSIQQHSTLPPHHHMLATILFHVRLIQMASAKCLILFFAVIFIWQQNFNFVVM